MLMISDAKDLFKIELVNLKKLYSQYKRLSFIEKGIAFFDSRIPGEDECEKATGFLTQMGNLGSVKELIKLTNNKQFNDKKYGKIHLALRRCVLEIVKVTDKDIDECTSKLRVTHSQLSEAEAAGVAQEMFYKAVIAHYETNDHDCTPQEIKKSINEQLEPPASKELK
jgi:hypothetical protein